MRIIKNLSFRDMTPAEFVADLYELKSKLVAPVDYKQLYAEPNVTYVVIQTLIATFSDKYSITHDEVRDILQKRYHEAELAKLS